MNHGPLLPDTTLIMNSTPLTAAAAAPCERRRARAFWMARTSSSRWSPR